MVRKICKRMSFSIETGPSAPRDACETNAAFPRPAASLESRGIKEIRVSETLDNLFRWNLRIVGTHEEFLAHVAEGHSDFHGTIAEDATVGSVGLGLHLIFPIWNKMHRHDFGRSSTRTSLDSGGRPWHLESQQDAVVARVEFLMEYGPKCAVPLLLGHQTIRSRHGDMRELRIQSGGRPLRVFYAFDPRRTSILLIGGDKTGNDRFYEEYVPVADALPTIGIWRNYERRGSSNEWTPFVSRVDQGVDVDASPAYRRYEERVASGDAVARVYAGHGN